MKTTIPRNWILSFLLIPLLLVRFGLSPDAQAAPPTPPPSNVNVVNTPNVNVVNTPSAPALVRDVDNAARIPFSQTFGVSIQPGQISNSNSVNIPAGKMLVVEFVSAQTIVNPVGTKPIILKITDGASGGITHLLVWNFQGTQLINSVGYDHFTASQQMRMYATSSLKGTVILSNVQTNTASGTVGVSVSGYLIDAP